MRKLDEEKDAALLEEWASDARKVELKDLEGFVRKLTTEYEHDYGTIVHACAAAMLAALSAVNKSGQGGITGFQAQCLAWMMIQDLFGTERGTPMQLIDYSNLLYPQYTDKFGCVSAATWEWAQRQAKQKLAKHDEYPGFTNPNVVDHWKSIADGVVPFGLRVVAD